MKGISAVIQWTQAQACRWLDGDDLNPIGQYATNPSLIHFPLKGTILSCFIISSFLVQKKKKSAFLAECVLRSRALHI